MQKYELVLMLKSQIQESERNELLSKIEKDFKDNILLKDEIGIHETSYDIKGQKGNNSVYYVSYYLNLDNEKLQDFTLDDLNESRPDLDVVRLEQFLE